MSKIKRPAKIKTSVNGNKYIVAEFVGKSYNVMLDADDVENWPNIKTITLGLRHFEHSMLPTDAVGVPTGPSFDRLEILDFETREELIADAEFDAKVELISKKMLGTVTLDNAKVDALLSTI